MDNLHRHSRIHLRHTMRETTMPSDELLPREAVPVTRTNPVEISKIILPRSTDSSSSDDTPRKTSSIQNVAIAVAVIVPVCIAIVVLIWLHRRHVRKLRAEDMNDPHKSLDFGMEGGGAGKKGKKGKKGGAPEMTMSDEKALRGRGVSMDLGMGMGNPYILPVGLQGSHDSLHSLSRSGTDSHDPYRPVTFVKDDASLRGSSLRGIPHDQSSMYTTSSGVTKRSNLGDGLLRNAQRMSQSHPPRGESLSPQDRSIPEIKFPEPAATSNTPRPDSDLREASPPPPPPPPPPPAPLQSSTRNNASSPPQSGEYTTFRPAEPMSPPSTLPNIQEARGPAPTSPSPPPFPRVQSQEAVVQSNANTTSFMSDSSYGEGFKVTPPSPPREPELQIGNPPVEPPAAPAPVRESIYANGLGVDDLGYDPRRLSMSVRPLPPDDPNENPEERANRIRSFYKEYFDDSRPEPQGNMFGDYYEDYGSEYLDGAIFDPETGQFVVASKPFAQPVTRRAMTPPPRAPPRFRSGSMGPRGNHFSSGSSSTGRHMPPRGMSSMSGRLPAGPRKPLPPPTPLSSLPTPSKLSEDSMVFNPIDFAPPVSFRDRQQGRRPDSPLGMSRPYSPSVRPHTPLASSFDDLAPMPSPHMLRRSGTFTALDFAPPPRFKDADSGSDAGSIRSNRSGISAAGRMGVRNGAYRVSKIPKGVVGTKDDIVKSLRPQLNMVAPA